MSKSTPVQVIVDDNINDPSILKYEGSWSLGGKGAEYLGTSHHTTTEGDSLSFTFYGNFYMIAGTLPAGNETNVVGWEYYMDSPKLLNERPWAEPWIIDTPHYSLGDGETAKPSQHMVNLTVTRLEYELLNKTFTFSVDYIIYNTTLEHLVESNSSLPVLIDDSDMDRIAYTGSWVDYDAMRSLWGTVRGTETVGSKATLNFTGTHVAVYGTDPRRAPNSSNTSVTFTLDNTTREPWAGWDPNIDASQKLFDAHVEDGNHELVITYTNELESSSFDLDYITYQPSLAQLNTNPSQDPAPAPTTSTTNSVGPSKVENHNAALIGGVVGGVIGLFAIVLVVWLLTRRRKATPPPAPNPHLGVYVENAGKEGFWAFKREDPSAGSLVSAPEANEINTTTTPQPLQARDGRVRVMVEGEELVSSPPSYQPQSPTRRAKT